MLLSHERSLQPGLVDARVACILWWRRRDDLVTHECKCMDRFGRGEANGSIPADAGFGQTICRQGSNVRAADNELHDALAAATCVKELRFVAIPLFVPS